ncbi:sigma factor-like helix-turn-helix DNA-binding protein [Sorangium sp. So ce726]|uniref:sigma factor-like helix-turn-helix DNA-binding protein n=1 Tax=Sorangium sp. So ce726 TaxID=3133319 RepID=UPI003F6483B6
MVDPSPRAAVVASLAGTLSRAVAIGDAGAARVVHEAIGQRLRLSAAPKGRARSVEPRERRVLILVGEGEQVSEVARNLGVPIGTAFSRLRRGRKRLAHVLKRWRRAPI